MKTKDYTGWIVGLVVLGAFVLLICAWVFFFWIASQNRVSDVPLETHGTQSPSAQVSSAQAATEVVNGQAAR